MNSTNAGEVTKQLENISLIIGYRSVLVYCNGSPSSNWKFIHWCQERNIKLSHSPAYFPQSNGQAEIFVHDVRTLLKAHKIGKNQFE